MSQGTQLAGKSKITGSVTILSATNRWTPACRTGRDPSFGGKSKMVTDPQNAPNANPTGTAGARGRLVRLRQKRDVSVRSAPPGIEHYATLKRLVRETLINGASFVASPR